MPTKKHVIVPELAKEGTPSVSEKPAETGKCGHLTRHSHGIDGKHDNLACTREPGHDGNHGAEHLELVESPVGTIEIGRKKYVKKNIYREWSDVAGTPVSQIPLQPIPRTASEQQKMDLAKMVFGDLPTGKFPQ